MNIANKLTVLRVILIPFFIVFGLVENVACSYTSLALFIIASFTDFLDGYLARKNNLVSDFGKFLDPLADKLLVFAALALLVHRGLVSVWVLYIVLLRELTVTGVRLIASNNGRVISAGWSGKIKTTFQMIVIIFALVPVINDNILNITLLYNQSILDLLMYIMVGLTLYSGAEYLIKNADVIKP